MEALEKELQITSQGFIDRRMTFPETDHMLTLRLLRFSKWMGRFVRIKLRAVMTESYLSLVSWVKGVRLSALVFVVLHRPKALGRIVWRKLCQMKQAQCPAVYRTPDHTAPIRAAFG